MGRRGASGVTRRAVGAAPHVPDHRFVFVMKLEAAEVLVAVSRHGRPAAGRGVPETRPRTEIGAQPAVGKERLGGDRRARIA